MSLQRRIALVSLACTVFPYAALAQSTTRVTIGPDGMPASAGFGAWFSADGRYVAFSSAESFLVSGDTNNRSDIFVHDRQTLQNERVSLGNAGEQTVFGCSFPSLSADLRFAAFDSNDPYWISPDTNGTYDVFVRDRQNATLERISVSSAGVQGNHMNRYPSMSADGRYVAFWSRSDTLVAGDTNGVEDVFVRDLQSGTTERASVATSGAESDANASKPQISADGRFVVFSSAATTLVPGDLNGVEDVFLRDLALGTTERISVDASGGDGSGGSKNPSISADGRYVAFESGAYDLVANDLNLAGDIFVRDRASGTTVLASVNSSGAQVGFSTAYIPALSGDGRRVAFTTLAVLAPNDTNNDNDLYLRDLAAGTTELLNLDSAGARQVATSPLLSGDGSCALLYSSKLGVGEVNYVNSFFVRDYVNCIPTVATYCTAKVNSAGCTPAIAASGIPSESAGSGFLITAEQVLPGKLGLLFYCRLGPTSITFQGGLKCLFGATKRTPLQTAGSSGPPPCTGTFTYDFNARIASGIDPGLMAGGRVWAQFWSRDAGVPSGTGLTDAVWFTICQ